MTFEIKRRRSCRCWDLALSAAPRSAKTSRPSRKARCRNHRVAERCAVLDPNQRFAPDAQVLYKLLFDQPLDQNPELKLIPKLINKWDMAADGLSLAVELRDDVFFITATK